MKRKKNEMIEKKNKSLGLRPKANTYTNSINVALKFIVCVFVCLNERELMFDYQLISSSLWGMDTAYIRI